MSGTVLIYGYPQGEWEPLLRACAEGPPDAVIVLGDCHLRMPLRQQIKSVFDAGISVMWIPGNHDADTEARYDFLWTSHPEGNLHTTGRRIGSIRIGGLGGVAKGRLCYPLVGPAKPMRTSRRHHLRLLSPEERWRDGLPLSMRDMIYAEDVQAFGRMRLDVLVSHEAPSHHRHGFVGVDEAARQSRVRLIVHGSTRNSYQTVLSNGVRVQGLARAEILRLPTSNLP